MSVLRSVLFNAAFWAWTAACVLLTLPLLAGPRGWTLAMGRFWTRGCLGLAGAILGLRFEVRGTPPRAPVIVACKHQSTWETLAMPVLLDRPAYVLKRELFWIPLLGQCFQRAGHIGVDRAGGARAMRGMLRDAGRAVGEERPIVIFPEGTRTPPGERRAYHPGVLALYTHLGLPVVPVALDSGLYWGRRSFVKRPGRIVVEFLDPIPPGLPRRQFLSELADRIDGASERLIEEARGGV